MGDYIYQLDEDTKEGLLLLDELQPKYPKVMADHIVYRSGMPQDESMPALNEAEIIGMADDGNGLQTAIVRLNGSLESPDGGIYHMTWSMDPDKKAPAEFGEAGKTERYNTEHSSGLLAQTIDTEGHLKTPANSNWKVQMFDKPLIFGADAKYVEQIEGEQHITDAKQHAIHAVPQDLNVGSEKFRLVSPPAFVHGQSI